MPPNDTAFTWTLVNRMPARLIKKTHVLITKVASPNYERLADSIKANALLLYPDIPTTVCTFRTKPTWFKRSKKDS